MIRELLGLNRFALAFQMLATIVVTFALRLRPYLVLVCSLLLLRVTDCPAADFYVATYGNDANPGTSDQPFATLQRARDAARREAAGTKRNIFVRAGKYYNVALLLQAEPGADDSGLTIQGCPGERAVLYGGQPLKNWQKVGAGPWYAASLPPFPAQEVASASTLTDWEIRMLLVDGFMAERAKYPTNAESLFYPDTSGLVLHYQGNDLGSWLVCTNAEFQLDYSWDSSTVGAATIDVNTRAVTFLTNPGRPLGFTGVKSYRVYNIAQGMSRPGQWYYDRAARRVVYWPKPGQDMNLAECIVPTTTRVLFLNGRMYARTHDITISNLTVAVATVPLSDEANYGNNYQMGLIQTKYTDSLILDRVKLGPTAGHAVYTRGSMQNHGERIQNCEVYSCGGGGIHSGADRAVINNNFVHSIGLMFPSAPGIRLASKSVVANNDVFDCKTSAIQGDYLLDSVIANNHVSNAVQVLRDMGAIYTWTSTNNVIASNFVENVKGMANDGSSVLDWFRHAIYCDLHTDGYQIYGNVTYDVPRPLMLNQCFDHIITNNFFIGTRDIVKLQPRGVLPSNIVFERNICYSTTNLYVEYWWYPNVVDNWNAVVDWRRNIFYSGLGGATGKVGIPTNAVALDPKFTSLAPLDTSFQPGSPAPGLGIMPIDLSKVGMVTTTTRRPPPPVQLRVLQQPMRL